MTDKGLHQCPVAECGADTRLDCGEPRCRKKIESTTMSSTDKNSLCQFWNGSWS